MKWLIGIGLIVLLGAGIFFYWGNSSETVSDKQSEVVQEVNKPLADAENAEKLHSESQSDTEERIEEITGE